MYPYRILGEKKITTISMLLTGQNTTPPLYILRNDLTSGCLRRREGGGKTRRMGRERICDDKGGDRETHNNLATVVSRLLTRSVVTENFARSHTYEGDIYRKITGPCTHPGFYWPCIMALYEDSSWGELTVNLDTIPEYPSDYAILPRKGR